MSEQPIKHGHQHCPGGPDPIPCLTSNASMDIWGYATYTAANFVVPAAVGFSDWTSVFAGGGDDGWDVSYLSQDAIDTGILYPEPDQSVLNMIIDGTVETDLAAGMWLIEGRAALTEDTTTPTAGQWVGLQLLAQTGSGGLNDGSVTSWQPADLIVGNWTIDHRWNVTTQLLRDVVSDTLVITPFLMAKCSVNLVVLFAEVTVTKIADWA